MADRRAPLFALLAALAVAAGVLGETGLSAAGIAGALVGGGITGALVAVVAKLLRQRIRERRSSAHPS